MVRYLYITFYITFLGRLSLEKDVVIMVFVEKVQVGKFQGVSVDDQLTLNDKINSLSRNLSTKFQFYME